MSVIKNDQLFSEQSLLSSDAGNLLEARSNGLYCGNGSVASNVAKDIYVDVNEGNDSNPGTKAQPFRTLVHALKSLTSVGEYVFHLKENQRHQLDADESIVIPGGDITFKPYSAESDKSTYAMNVIIDIKPKGLVDGSVNRDGSLFYLDWSVITASTSTFFTFRALKIHLHEHLYLPKTREQIRQYTNENFYMGTFRKKKPSVVISAAVISSSIHFNYQEQNWREQRTGGLFHGGQWKSTPDVYIFSTVREITGYGNIIYDPNITTFISGSHTSNNVFEDKPELWEKYFSHIRVDSRGNLNCQLDVNLRRYVKGYR